MKNYAVLDTDSLVTNIIIASSLEIAESTTSSVCVLVPAGTETAIGWSYINETFVNPNPPVEETPE